MRKAVLTFVFQSVIRNGVLRHILWYTCANPRQRSCAKRYAKWTASVHTLVHMRKPMRTFVFQDLNTQWTASVHTLVHMRKPVLTFVFKALYAMDCFGTYFGTHAQSRVNIRVQSSHTCSLYPNPLQSLRAPGLCEPPGPSPQGPH